MSKDNEELLEAILSYVGLFFIMLIALKLLIFLVTIGT